jgi:hypothetical protein
MGKLLIFSNKLFGPEWVSMINAIECLAKTLILLAMHDPWLYPDSHMLAPKATILSSSM